MQDTQIIQGIDMERISSKKNDLNNQPCRACPEGHYENFTPPGDGDAAELVRCIACFHVSKRFMTPEDYAEEANA